MSTTDELHRFLEQNPQTDLIELVVPDMAGCLRGKRIPRREFESVFASGFNIPGGSLMLDVMGNVCDGVTYGYADGDPDVSARVVPGTLAAMPWVAKPSGQALFSLFERNGDPYFADSRMLLDRIAGRIRQRGLKIVMATELEFFLLDAECDTPTPHLPRVFGTSQKQGGNQTYQTDDLWQIEKFLAELSATCEAQNLPISTAISEFAPGQLEVNLHHTDDPLRACDHAVLLKRAAKACALRHGYVACFMAKPFAEEAGSGLHIHLSLVDQDGNNFFSGGIPKNAEPPFSADLRHAVGGLADSMADCMALFAPNANSYRRLRPDYYAPVMANWGSNHRQVSLRIPLSSAANTRIEHRTAGADANPYLVAAAMLAGVDAGLTANSEPPAMVAEGAEIDLQVTLPIRWHAALDAFAESPFITEYFGRKYQDAYVGVRRTEERRFHNEITERDFQWYLRQV